MKKIVNWLKNEESGQGMVEYGLLLALIAVVVIAALVILGPKVGETFNKVSNKLPA
jgi:pilus assembly protein Flp/PilA